MSLKEIDAYDGSSLYNLKEPTKLFHGQMYSLKEQWVICTESITSYQRIISKFTNKEDTYRIDYRKLNESIAHICRLMIEKVNKDNRFLKAMPFDYNTEANYYKLSDKVGYFDANKVALKSFVWPIGKHYKIKLLIQIYGIFVYTTGDGFGMMAKLSTKIMQVQIEGEANEEETIDVVIDVCLL